MLLSDPQLISLTAIIISVSFLTWWEQGKCFLPEGSEQKKNHFNLKNITPFCSASCLPRLPSTLEYWELSVLLWLSTNYVLTGTYKMWHCFSRLTAANSFLKCHVNLVSWLIREKWLICFCSLMFWQKCTLANYKMMRQVAVGSSSGSAQDWRDGC